MFVFDIRQRFADTTERSYKLSVNGEMEEKVLAIVAEYVKEELSKADCLGISVEPLWRTYQTGVPDDDLQRVEPQRGKKAPVAQERARRDTVGRRRGRRGPRRGRGV